MRPELCLLRGGGDLATGVAWRLSRAGWPVVVCELPDPLTVRRTVAMSTAVHAGEIDVEGMVGRLAVDAGQARAIAAAGDIGVVVAPDLPDLDADVIVDARVAKRNIDTTIGDAELVVGLGPGFVAGVDCHAVVETQRGPHLGRVLWSGSAEPDTGEPGEVGGRGTARVVRAPASGTVRWRHRIGDVVAAGGRLGSVDGIEVVVPFPGLVRGLLRDGQRVRAGTKIGDIDPRVEPRLCREISDKALAVGGGVLEAVLSWPRH